jgi:isoleucyl-tRNA synthetase
MERYDPVKIEEQVLEFWKKNRIYERARRRNKGKKPFRFLDGPPYPTGSPHPGLCWNKCLKDAILRYKRMNGFDVWDKPGYDMHGLPIEVETEKRFGIKNKKEIVENLGAAKFIQECKKFASLYANLMTKAFKRLGVWMDWENPYLTLENRYIEGVWWAIKKAWENKLLYQGDKVLTWCWRCATALAKHELEYKRIKELSIYLKFPFAERDFLIVWTTTPWTIPCNLAIMVNPDFSYAKVRVGDELWIIAKDLVAKVMDLFGKDYEVVEEVNGKELEGLSYRHPLEEEIPAQKKMKEKYEWAHKVILSKEFVSLETGTGLVHSAPGAGPEDFEVGKRYGLPAFCPVDENGVFTREAGRYKGLLTKKEDYAVVEDLKGKGLLIKEEKIEHEYPFCWRCKSPVIFRATRQWFLAISKLREDLVKENEQIIWVPEWAGLKFHNWLAGIEDWCISRQRFWGIPLPIWRCPNCKRTRVIGSIAELRKAARVKKADLHKQFCDRVKLRCECGKEMIRSGDILDVWLDSGAASWASLSYPSKKLWFKKFWPAEFIAEGPDQIRGWFSSQLGLSLVSHGKSPYQAVHMHGYMCDERGIAMHKSRGNYVPIEQIISKHGADPFRFFCLQTPAGRDVKFSFKELGEAYKELNVFWNTHLYILRYLSYHKFKPRKRLSMRKLKLEDRWLFSRLNSTIEKITHCYENYLIPEVPRILKELFLDLSRWYIHLVRDRIFEGDKVALQLIYQAYLKILAMISTVTPFISEAIYQNFRKQLRLREKSIHFLAWPQWDKKLVDPKLEEQMGITREVVSSLLATREKARLGIRWPLRRATIVGDEATLKACENLKEIIKEQANLKDLSLSKKIPSYANLTLKIVYEKLKRFEEKFPIVVRKLLELSPAIVKRGIEKEGKYVIREAGEEFEIFREDVTFSYLTPKEVICSRFSHGWVFLEIRLDEELLSEGYSRELIRRIQDLRKELKLKREDRVLVELEVSEELARTISPRLSEIKKRTGSRISLVSRAHGRLLKEFKIGKERMRIGITPA